jgi:hypothetical protein
MPFRKSKLLWFILAIFPLTFLSVGVVSAAPPANDNFDNAILLTGTSGSASVSVAEATYETNEPASQYCSKGTAWYKWVAPANGKLQVISGGQAETGFSCSYILVGSAVGSLSTLADRQLLQAFGIHARLIQDTVQVQSGQTYFIQTSAAEGYYAANTFASFSFAFTQPPIKLVAAVLPTARSVSVGTPATAYGTMINTSSSDLYACLMAMPSGVPATFQYRAADALNNFTAPLNTAVTIPAGGTQNFIFGFTPTTTIDSQDIQVVFDCVNSAPAASIAGLDTFLLSASTAPVPDLISISVTPSTDGITNIPGDSGTGLFVASTVNIGTTAAITATVDDNGRQLPLHIALCRTDPSNGECTNPATPGPSSTFTLGNNEIATFSIFVQGAGNIPFDPANSRLFLRFKTSDQVTRGATSVAVRTQ